MPPEETRSLPSTAKELGMSGGASFETRPYGTLLRMRKNFYCTTIRYTENPHAEEAAERPSRNMYAS
jgi:hypothetical protein